MNAVDTALAIMDALRVCLTAELTTPVCSMALVPGATVYPDNCSCDGDGCGQAWVRLDSVFPTKTFPIQDTSKDNCGAAKTAVIELGIYRCVPTLRAGGEPPTGEDLTNAAILAGADAGAMLAAISCCPAVTDRPYMLGRYTPRDAGDCGGGTWPVTVMLVNR